MILDSIILVQNVLQFDFVCFISGFCQVLVKHFVAFIHGSSCSIGADLDHEVGMVVVEEAPESVLHVVVERPCFVAVGYSLSTEEMAAFQGLVDAEGTSLVDQEGIIMDCCKGEAQLDQYSDLTEAVDYSI